MSDKRNVLWDKHRMYLPDMREKAIHCFHRCEHCKFFVAIKGKTETRKGCVVNIKVYGNLEKRIPTVIPIIEIIKQVGLKGLEQCLKNNDLNTQSCGKFQLNKNKQLK